MPAVELAQQDPVAEGTLLWEPSTSRIAQSKLTEFVSWLEHDRDLAFTGYDDVWRWSVERLEEFWSAIHDYFDVLSSGHPRASFVPGRGAEGASWFPGAELNYVAQVARHPPASLALIAVDETGSRDELTYGRLVELVAAAARGLRSLGVARGDRVVAVLPNGTHAVVAFLATASIGAIWSSCAPEFGAPSMVDRFSQVDPKVLIATRGYNHRGRFHDISDKVVALEEALAGLAATVLVPSRSEAAGTRRGNGPEGAPSSRRAPFGRPQRLDWGELLSGPSTLRPESVEFSHPLWILYSSGTTGLPKPIVHGHGGILLEHLKALSLHSDLGPHDRFFWFTTTGWMMWNFLIGGLLVGATIVCYDGDPLWPDASRLWRLAKDEGITYFGTSAPYLEALRRSGFSPRDIGEFGIRSIGSTGAPLSPEGFAWATREVGDDVLVGSVSGGTDVCTAFLASCPWMEVRAGELQCRALGAKVEAFDEAGRPVSNEVGELVVTAPMPSMPVALWGDFDGSRLHESYFGYFEGVWRHGDWVKITSHGSAVVYGRSDATLNRGGVRMGTAEFYRVVEGLPEVEDALVVDTSELGREGELVLFVVPSARASSGDAREKIRRVLRESLSPRHVPDRIVEVNSLPRTMNGKKLEVPIRRILLGAPVEKAVALGALSDATALDSLLDAISEEGLL